MSPSNITCNSKQRVINKGKTKRQFTSNHRTNQENPQSLTRLSKAITEVKPEQANMIEINQVEQYDEPPKDTQTMNTSYDKWNSKLTEPQDRPSNDEWNSKLTEPQDRPSNDEWNSKLTEPQGRPSSISETNNTQYTHMTQLNTLTSKLRDNWQTIPENIFPIHNTVSETHLTKLYGIHIQKKMYRKKMK